MHAFQQIRLSARNILRSLILVIFTLVSGAAIAGEINDEGGVAIQGYDPVAYFTDGKPVEGDPKFTSKYKGAIFQFASAAHRDSFKANPAKYAPQFGGYCAYAAASGSKASVNPEAFTVVNNKLYLNYSKPVRYVWSLDTQTNIVKAEQNWPKISKQ